MSTMNLLNSHSIIPIDYYIDRQTEGGTYIIYTNNSIDYIFMDNSLSYLLYVAENLL